VPVPQAMHHQYQNLSGREVIFGIRPEDMYSSDFMKDYKEEAVVKGIVEVIEPLGPEILLDIRCGENSFVARVDPRVETDLGQEIKLILDMEKMHIFEADSPHRRIGD